MTAKHQGRRPAAHPSARKVARVPQASNGDDLLTKLAATDTAGRRALLGGQSTGVLQQALDLCGEDASGLSRRALIDGILASF